MVATRLCTGFVAAAFPAIIVLQAAPMSNLVAPRNWRLAIDLRETTAPS